MGAATVNHRPATAGGPAGRGHEGLNTIAIRRRTEKATDTQGLILPSSGPPSEVATTDQRGPDHGDANDLGAAAAEPAVSEGQPWRLLGDILVSAEVVEAAVIETALAAQSSASPSDRRRLGEMLVADGTITSAALAMVLARQHDLPTINLLRVNADASLVARMPWTLSEGMAALPIREEGGVVTVAVADPTMPDLLASLEATIGSPVALAVCSRPDLDRARGTAYEAAEGLGDIIRAYEARNLLVGSPDAVGAPVDENAPIVQVVTRIVNQAVKQRASDVHIEPLENRVRVRNRVDGALQEVLSLPSSMSQALSSRIKIMAGLNIVERRRPQDGQIEITSSDRQLDIRVSTAGTMFGESVVLRILDRQRALYGLAELGMPDDVERRYRDVIQSPYGLVVCAGPTGSGKTTTLYTTLQTVKSDEINVVTVEDPVEYVFPDINQMSINETAGLTFASGLRAILRQDPDTILVGEIRDVETARIAIQAALTGHFVLSTVHATDAASAMHRFIDMGIESFLLSSALLATVGQRLVRRSCDSCSESYRPTPEEMAFYERAGGQKAGDDVFRRGTGCDVCSGTGYFGRVGVYEVLRMSDALRDAVIDKAQSDDIRRLAIEDGMVPMQERAITMVDKGETTVADVMRTVYVL